MKVSRFKLTFEFSKKCNAIKLNLVIWFQVVNFFRHKITKWNKRITRFIVGWVIHNYGQRSNSCRMFDLPLWFSPFQQLKTQQHRSNMNATAIARSFMLKQVKIFSPLFLHFFLIFSMNKPSGFWRETFSIKLLQLRRTLSICTYKKLQMNTEP